MGSGNDLLFDTPGWTIKHPKNKHIKLTHEGHKAKKQRTEKMPQQSEESKVEKTSIVTKSNNNNNNQLAQSLSNSKLAGSRFRMLNETLYTSTGPEAFELFKQKDSDHQSNSTNQDFEMYHVGFSHQVQSWPQNPVNLIAHQLMNQQPQEKKNKGQTTTLVADLGCGQAPLAKLLSKSSAQTFHVFSFDLVADPDGWVTVAECSTTVPLPGSTNDQICNAVIDVAVCCLSLMSTDWVGMILEARRILKLDGELRIAEVSSRFIDIDEFVRFITSIGFSNPIKDQSNSHFILFKFKKTSPSSSLSKTKQVTQEVNASSKHDLIKLGQKYLKPCIYKRR